MPDAATTLQRVLLLERQKGYLDRAAVGGLADFARIQAERSDHPGVRAAAGVLIRYGQADRRGRERAVGEALRVLLIGTAAAEPVPLSPPVLPVQPNAPPREPGVSEAASSTECPAPAPRRAVDLDARITTVKGVGPALARTFGSVGVTTLRELLYYLPRTHYDYTDTRSISRMRVGEPMTLIGRIEGVRNNRTARGLVITTATIADDTGTVGVRWFNQPYMAKQLPVGARIAITGEPDLYNGYVTFHPRDYELIETDALTHAARLVPVYPLTKGLTQRPLRRLLRGVLDGYGPGIPDLPPPLRTEFHLPALGDALSGYHFPDDEREKAAAQRRLAFDELLLIQLGLMQRKREWQQPLADVAIPRDVESEAEFVRVLPFRLTGAQERVIEEIRSDLTRPVPMSRLVQGDVGSGKTVVAAAALLQVARSGKQGMLMAPTEILAEQHHRTLQSLLAPVGVHSELLIGSTPKKRRREISAGLAAGEIAVLVGTHALIQEGVELPRLGLAITDEQHRFGVEQRAALRQKGMHPHILAMTATPIPRTLAMTIYGDLDVSAIDEMPPGRQPVITTWSRTAREAYGVVRDEIERGHQAFVVCPVIEESADSDMRSVVAEHAELEKSVFSDRRVGLLHGRMRPAEKDRILNDFRDGVYDILVATSVVEVGIDIPNATVMVIRDAHRFGLAQLHQFRGRVGRGGDQSFCVLLSDAQGDEARERLEAVTATENGFELAEQDLRLRGPGEFWGIRQSGLPTLRVATLSDVATIEAARRAARMILDHGEDLADDEYRPLRHEMERFWHTAADLS